MMNRKIAKALKMLLPLLPPAFIVANVVLFSPSCANTTTPPSGGPKDTIPPVIRKMEPMSGADKFNAKVAEVKRDWLAKHLPSVKWDEIQIVPYGVPKSNCATCPNAILFDDEQRNLNEWTANTHNMAYNADLLMEILRHL